jgi:hypothetical protein
MIDVADLVKNRKRRGEWAELRFMAEAAQRGFSVSKPWGDSERYDVGIEHNGQYQRVQVKSVSWHTGLTYRCAIGCSRAYKSSEIDFFAIFIVPEELWYIVPVQAAVATGNRTLCITPSRKKNRHEVYREAWHLLRSRRFVAGGSQVVVEGELFEIG